MNYYILHFILLSFLSSSYSNEVTHSYTDSDEVILWVNKVGPYHNPQETYLYFSLPYCLPDIKLKENKSKIDSIGSYLEGNDLLDSGLHIKYKVNIRGIYCKSHLDNEEANDFIYAIKNHYWFQMYIDELPIWGMVGEIIDEEINIEDNHSTSNGKSEIVKEDKSKVYAFTHKAFSISYNNDRIIHVNLTMENPVLVKPEVTLSFSYSVNWIPTDTLFEDRFNVYLDYSFFEHQIHWFSIFNSFMMVVFLVGLVALILSRTLKNDYQKFAASESEELDLDRAVDEAGWRLVLSDVFRAPSFLLFFCSLIGTGVQLAVTVFGVLVTAALSTLYIKRGGTLTTIIVWFSLSAFVNGYVSAGYFKRAGGENWKKLMALTAILFPLIICSVGFGLNLLANIYASAQDIPVTTMMTIAAIWSLICVPLTVLGSLLGRSMNTKGDFPCRVNHMRRPIPELRMCMQPWIIGILAGVLPFGSIFIEMYFVFTSFWNYKFYYVYGFMLLVYVILLIVTVCVTIVVTYFMLNSEDYRWHWISFFSGASTSFYVFIYSIYYFFFKTHMFGFFQTVFYFGNMFVVALSIFLLCGSIGFLGASLFVQRIYWNIKGD